MKSDINFTKPISQEDFYNKNGGPEEILKYVRLQGKTYGVAMEQIAKEHFNMDVRTSTRHDHKKNGEKLEQKSARWHADGNDFKWQHVRVDHDWDYLLLCGLEFDKVLFWIAPKDVVKNIIEMGIGSDQSGQGWWFSRSDFTKTGQNFTDYFAPIYDDIDLLENLKK